jgi:DHA1 family bicyclomycin/chloramphenicol resistance-like MFS transporter
LLVFLWKFLPETLKNKDRHIFSLKKILENSVVLFKNKVFLRNSLISSFIYASLWGFIATAPFVFNSLGVQQVDFGLYTLLVVIFYMAGAAFNSYCINHFSSKFLIWAGLLGTLLGGITLLFITLYAKVSPLMLVGVVGLYTFSMSFVFPNVTSNALDAVDSSLGMASSMLSGLEMFMAALAIYFMGNAQNTNFLNVSFGFIFSSIICIVIFKTLHPRFIKI